MMTLTFNKPECPVAKKLNLHLTPQKKRKSLNVVDLFGQCEKMFTLASNIYIYSRTS